MLSRRGCGLAVALAVAVGIAFAVFLGGWYGSGPLAKDDTFIVPNGASLGTVAERLEAKGVIGSADGFKLRARVFGGGGTSRRGSSRSPRMPA